MGVSIDIHVYNLDTLLPDIEKHVEDNGGYREGAIPVRQWFLKVSPEFGIVADGKFYTLWNEYFEDYNAASQFLEAVDMYYFPERDEDEHDGFWCSGYETVSGANAHEVLESLFEDEFGEEGKFTDEY